MGGGVVVRGMKLETNNENKGGYKGHHSFKCSWLLKSASLQKKKNFYYGERKQLSDKRERERILILLKIYTPTLTVYKSHLRFKIQYIYTCFPLF